MSLNRRDFVKLCTGTVAGFGISQMYHPAVKEALAETLNGERPPVLWLQGQLCTGCSVSLLDTVSPSVAELLLKIISLEFLPTVMVSEGEQCINHLYNVAKTKKGQFFIAVEGAIPVDKDGKYCIVGEIGHKEYTMAQVMKDLAPDAAAILAIGTCAAYGGIPAAEGSETGALGVAEFLKQNNIATPVVNIPGCPPHPDWITGTIVAALGLIKEHGLEKGLGEVVKILDTVGRPLPFFGNNVHDNCPFVDQFFEDKFSKSFTDKADCRYDLGCKGPATNCNSYKDKWNGVNWCVANAICIGCTEPGFPDEMSPFYSN